MNVACPECQTEFALDDAQIPPGGLQVQCTRCNAVFNARKDNPNLPPARSDGEWMVRQAHGNVFRLRELTTLQRWIVERKVQREDEISRTGQKWERLGNIAELAAFFQVVDASSQASQLAQPITHTPIPAPSASPPAAAPGPAPTSASAPAVPSGSVLDHGALWEQRQQNIPAAPPTGRWEMQSGSPDFDDELDDDLDFRPRRRGWLWIALVFAFIGAGGAFYATQSQLVHGLLDRMRGELPPEITGQIDRAYLSLMPNTPAAFDEAEALVSSIREAQPGIVEVDVALAEVLLARVHFARRHRAVVARLPEGVEAPEAIVLDESAVKKTLDRVAELLRAVVTEAPESLAGKRALTELQWLRGNRESAEKLARELESMAGVERDRRTQRLLAQMRRDWASLKTLTDAVPGMMRARVDLAWARLQEEQLGLAKAEASAVVDAEAHPTARAMVTWIDQRDAASPEDEASGDAEPDAGSDAPAADAEGPGFERLLAMADRARLSDRPERSLVLYERALELEPSDLEAISGMGFAYIDLGKASAATATFRRVLQLNERFSPAHMGLAEAFRMRNMKRDALEHYRRYLELLPNGPEAPVARRMIETLQGP